MMEIHFMIRSAFLFNSTVNSTVQKIRDDWDRIVLLVNLTRIHGGTEKR
ncbi:hypothetical protein JXQ70_04370 [bacterium]|nr:hypothetical protein [bacterium]